MMGDACFAGTNLCFSIFGRKILPVFAENGKKYHCMEGTGNMAELILVIDDDKELGELLCEYMEPEGFDVEVAHNGADGLELVDKNSYCIIILDIMLPGGQNGFDILQRIRRKYKIPVIMLTARGEEVDRIIGLEMGADDYLPKPFNPRELIARIRAVLRRVQAEEEESSSTVYRAGDLLLDTVMREVKKSGQPVKLTGVEYSLLEVFLRNSGSVLSRDTLVSEVLDRPLLPYDRSLDVHICNLRRKLDLENDETTSIKAIRGSGYIFISSSMSQE